MRHSELYDLFIQFWWLLIPLGWGLQSLLRLWMTHRRSERLLGLITAYAERGQTPPPELLDALRMPTTSAAGWLDRPETFWRGGLVLAALCLGFAVLSVLKARDGDNITGLIFVTVLLGAFAAASFLSAMVGSRRPPTPDAP
ncbi:MAG: hypothetical protein GC145_06925 [Caulobacter sp.]|nr:hypothetical protein [Caulobacter sp.]